MTGIDTEYQADTVVVPTLIQALDNSMNNRTCDKPQAPLSLGTCQHMLVRDNAYNQPYIHMMQIGKLCHEVTYTHMYTTSVPASLTSNSAVCECYTA